MFKRNRSSILLVFFVLLFCLVAAGSVSAADPVSANFTSNVTNGSAPLSVQFNDTSTGNATSWSWDFGYKQTSTEQNPIHTYTAEGKYNVSFTAINGAGNSTIIKNDYINVAIPPTVTASLTGGTYNTTQAVTLTSDDPSATIYYANDKTDPRTSATKIIYTGPITITNTTTLRYAAVDTYGNWSILYLQNYVIGNGTVSTGQSNYTGPETSTTLWTYTTTGGSTSYYGSPVIGSDGTIYIGSYDGNLYALNSDGTHKWNYTTGGSIYGSLTIGADGTIYIGTSGGKFYAINPNGTSKWNYTTPGNDIYGSAAIGADGTIYVGSYDKNLYALNSDGTQKWNYTTGGPIYGSAAIGADGTIYVGSYDKNLYALNPDGTLKWNYTAGGYIYCYGGSPTIGADGTIYVGSYDKKLYAINPDGTLNWFYTTGNRIYGSAAIGADGTIYVGSYDKNFYAINPNGTFKWSYTTGNRIYGPTLIGADGIIYVGSDDGKLYALSSNGTLNWSYATGNSIRGSATIDSNGTIYFISYNKVYALKDVVPGADFTSDVNNGGVPITIQFTDKSLHDASSWLWDFGDGTTDSTDQNPTHTYTTAGDYTVTLTAFNLVGNSTKTSLISLSNLPPIVNFTSDVTSTTTFSPVKFKDTSLYATSWAWDFNGDGIIDSTEQNPIYSGYKTIGYYTVNLTVTGPGGSNSITKTDYILILPSVNASVYGGCYNTTQTVTLTSDDPAATIYYTNDTTDPRTSNKRLKYVGPITIDKTTALRYAAVDSAGRWSPLYIQNYIIGALETGGFGDPKNIGLSNCTGPQVNTTLWNYTTGGSISSWSSPVIGSDGTIYVGSDDGKVYALNVDGTVKWIYATGMYNKVGSINSLTIGADGTIYAVSGSYDNRLYALNVDGTLKWNYKAPGNIYNPKVGADGTIYLGCTDGKLYALDHNGTLKWTYDTGTYIYSRGRGPAIGSDGTIYVESVESYSRGGNLYALNPDGTLKWTYTIGGNLQGSPTVGPDGTIYVGGADGKLYALNPDGTLKWNSTLGGTIYGATIGVDGTIYVGSTNNQFYAVNVDGTLKWNYATGAGIYGATIVGSDGTIYVGSTDGKLYAFRPDGILLWTYTTGGAIYNSVAISANETLYFGSGDKNIYAIASTVCRANQTAGAAPLTVQFNASDISPGSWSWDFGDGTSSTDQNPIHTYRDPGFYNVTLTVTRSNGQIRTVRFTSYIKVYNPPVSSFTATTSWGAVPGATPAIYNNIQFSDTSANIPTAWYWDFGDGTTSILQNPTHAYTSVGDYIVKLTVINPAGNNTFSYPVHVMGTISANSTLPAGTYNTTQTVTLTSDDPAATIYYTNDTTDPRTSSTRVKYTEPITISKTTTLRHAAVTSIGKWSPLYVQNYVIGIGGLIDSPSPTYQGDNNHTGQSEYTGPQTNNTKWNNTEITSIQDNGVSIGSDGTIYAGSSIGYLYALYPTGVIKWVYYTGSLSMVTTPTIGQDGTIYIAASNYLHALRADGTLIWKLYISSTNMMSPTVGSDGTIYVANYDNSGFLESALYAINPDGSLKWNTTIFNADGRGNIVIGSDGTIYVPGSSLYAVNPDGTIKWTYDYLDHQFTSPSIGLDGTIYYLCYSGTYSNKVAALYAINPDGTLKWTYLTKNAQYGTAAIGSDGTIYLLNGGYLFAINSADGTQKWNCSAVGAISSPVIGADGTIYLAANNGLLAIRSTDGTIKWSCTSISSNGNPVIDSDGTLYIGTGKGLFAFRDVAAKFEYAIGSNPLFVEFNDTSNNATTWSWIFGDGTNSTLQNPTHKYAKSGQYMVTLNALTPEGILTAAQMITIGDIAPPTVIISPNGGDFNTTFNVTLNATDDSGTQIVYYTTDGSDPRTSSTRGIYTAPIGISGTVTLKYAAVDSSGNWSPVYRETYTKSEVISGVIVYVQDASYYTGSLNDEVQSILDNAASGSNIVFLGQLYENLHLVINKKLNLISNVGTKISLSDSSVVFLINGTQASGSTIKGFIIISTGSGSGIVVNNTNNVTISNSQISSSSGTAVQVNGSSNTTIRSSSIHDSATGISVSGSTGTQVNDSNIYNNTNGVIIENSQNTSTNQNQITGNTKNGVSVSNSNNTTINDNTIKKNGNTATTGSGIYLENSTNININSNQINENFYGITANNVTNATIKNNTFLNNDRDGILLNGNITNTTILGNTLQQNDNGININCGSENLTIRANLITDSQYKVSGQQMYHGSGIFIGENYRASSTFLLEHNVIRNNANMDFRSCQAAGTYIRGSNWYGSGCKQVTYDPQMRMAILKTGEKAFTVLFYDGVTGKIVTDLPSFSVAFMNGAYSQTVMIVDGMATAVFENLANGDVVGSAYEITVSTAYNSIITSLDGSSNDDSDPGKTGPGDSSSSGSTGTGPGSGSGSGGSSGSGASSGSASAVGATAESSAAGSSGSSCQGDCSKTVQELIVDDVIKNPNVWAIIGVVLLLVLVLGAYYRKDLMNMIQKSKK
nr:PQQ-binding-like beta-propeller repeat protein [uncultured Methanobacterium sp.]